MFTGIIREVGRIRKVTAQGKNGLTFEIQFKKLSPPKIGGSICVNGACLTVVSKKAGSFSADVIPETLVRTNLNRTKVGDEVNLEPSLRASDRVDGGFVSGHIDSVGIVEKIGEIKNGIGLTISLPKNLKPFVAEKGSIVINGVSLTVTRVSQTTFDVALIPFTYQNTNLGRLKKGHQVNLEADMLARYLYHFTKVRP